MTTSILPGTTRSGGHARTYKLGAGLRMRGATSGRVGILPPTTITDYDLTLPAALGASDKLLQVSSAGVVSLVDPVTIGGTGTEILYRGGVSSAAAVAGSSWDGTTLTLPNVTTPRYQDGGGIVLGSLAGTFGRRITTDGNDIYIGIPTGRRLFVVNQGGTAVCSITDARQIYLGPLTSATPAAGYLYGTGGSGTNVVGGNLIIAPGPSTGKATPSSVIIQSTVAGTSGSTSQTLVDTLWITNGRVGIGKSPDRQLEVYISSSGEVIRLSSGTQGNASLGLSAVGVYVQSLTANRGVWLYNAAGTGVVGVSGLGNVGVGTTSPEELLHVAGNVRVDSANYHYWGASDVDGSWRIGRSGNDIVIERRESGAWVTKSTISP